MLKMKKNIRFMMLCAACAVFFGSAIVNFAQVKPPVVGGYKTVSVDDAAVAAAAEFAVSDHSQKNEVSLEVVSISKAERQIVQGTNYRLCIEVKVVEEGNDETQFVLAVVYQNLKKAYTLKSWKADGCASDGTNNNGEE